MTTAADGQVMLNINNQEIESAQDFIFLRPKIIMMTIPLLKLNVG